MNVPSFIVFVGWLVLTMVQVSQEAASRRIKFTDDLIQEIKKVNEQIQKASDEDIAAGESVSSGKPNFLIILADDQGFADAGWQGSTQVKTPNLDWLAERSTVLTRHYVQQICTPSRGSLMTGYYPIKTGLQHDVIHILQPYGLPLQFDTIPQIFREKAGYETHLVGKWHLGFFKEEYTPTYRGFDTFFGVYGGMAGFFNHAHKGPPINGTQFYGVDFHEDFRGDLNPTGQYFGNYSDDLFGERARQIVLSHNKHNPLFLYLSFQGVHDPLEAKSEYNKDFPNIWTWERRQYAMMLKALDDNVGKVIDALKSRRMLENTYILFSSDNGGLSANDVPRNLAQQHGLSQYQGSNYPLRGTKWTNWEGGVRVPAFIKGPGIPEQVTYDSYVHITDWLPTFYSAIGGDVADLGPIDGVNQLKALRANAKQGPRNEILVNIDPGAREGVIISGQYKLHTAKHGLLSIIPGQAWAITDGWYYDYGPFGQNNKYRADKIGDWKLSLVTCNNTDEIGTTCNLRVPDSLCLFNIIEDPCEYNNIADENPDVVANLMKKLAEYESQMVSPVNQPPDPNSNPALRGGFWSPWM